jgi:hypothetical protein
MKPVNNFQRILQDYRYEACTDHKKDILNAANSKFYKIGGKKKDAAGNTFAPLSNADYTAKMDQLKPLYKKGVICRRIAFIATAIFVALLVVGLSTAPLLGAMVSTAVSIATLITAAVALSMFIATIYFQAKAKPILEALGRHHLLMAQHFIRDNIGNVQNKHKTKFAEFVAEKYRDLNEKAAWEACQIELEKVHK